MTHHWFHVPAVRCRLGTLAILTLWLAACGGDSGPNTAPSPPTPPPPPAAVATVTISPDSGEAAIGATLQLTAVPRDAQGATLTGRSITWTSADPTIASVSQAGLVSALVPGRVQVTATAEGRSATALVRVRGVADTIIGAATSLAVSAIPRKVARTRAEDYRKDHPTLTGLSISFNTVMVLVEPATTVGVINTLLRSVDAKVLGGFPGAAGQAPGGLVLRLPTRSFTELAAAMQTLRQSPAIRLVTPDVLLSGNEVSARSSDAEDAAWTWNTVTPAMSQGNWGHKVTRVPQLWNFNDLVRKSGALTATGVLDGGFVQHPDLSYLADLTNPDDPTFPEGPRHGTLVSGIIAARFDNGLGVDGVNPFARLVVQGGSASSTLLTIFEELLLTPPGPAGRLRVINVSQAFNFGKVGIDMNTREDAREMARAHGEVVEAILSDAQRAGVPLPVIVVAAGNDRQFFPSQPARFASPFANAAIDRGVAAIIVVEAVQLGSNGTTLQTSFSNDGGHLSAPGLNIMSTTPSVSGKLYDRTLGTSMATPYVAGVVGYLLALDPAFPAPTLTTNPMRNLLRATAAPATNAAPLVDAFAAALELDRVRGGDRVLRALLDVDDGTIDGNTRVDPRSGQPVLGDAPGARDGRIDMRDFRRWRDHQLQVENDNRTKLNGAPNHPKRDLNGDGQSGTITENVFPRTDFNGDGRLAFLDAAPMAGLFGGERRTDLQVLQRLFDDPDYTKDDLPDLVDSGDLLFDPVACLAIPGVTRVRGTVRRRDQETAFKVFDLTSASPRRMVTVASEEAGYRTRLSARNAQGEELAYFEAPQSPEPGEDVLVEGECFRLKVDVIFPELVTAGAPQPLSIKVTRMRPRLETEVLESNADVTVTVVGGTVTNAFGTTNAAGEFGTTIVPGSGPPTLTVIIEVETANGGTSVMVTRPIGGALPCAPTTVATNVVAGNDAQLSNFLGVGKTDRSLGISGTFDQFVDLRRFCEAGINMRVLLATFRGGVRLDGITSVGGGNDGDVVNDADAGVLEVWATTGLEHLAFPRLRLVGHTLRPDNNGVKITRNFDLRTISMGQEVPVMEITRLAVDSNPKLTSLRVFSEMRLPSPLRYGYEDQRMTRVQVLRNATLESVIFGKVNAINFRVQDNPALRTLTVGVGSVFVNVTISGNPLLESLVVPCGALLSSTITITGSPKLNRKALQTTVASCATAAGVSPAAAMARVIMR